MDKGVVVEEKLQRAMARIVQTDAKLSREVVADAIGEAVLALLESGRDCDSATLLQWFDEAISARPEGFRRQRCEDARTALRDALTKTAK